MMNQSTLWRSFLFALVFIFGIVTGVVAAHRTNLPMSTSVSDLNPAQHRAHEVALQLLHQRRATARWTEDDARQLRELLPQLSASARDDVMSNVAKLLNAGQLKLSYSGSSLGR